MFSVDTDLAYIPRLRSPRIENNVQVDSLAAFFTEEAARESSEHTQPAPAQHTTKLDTKLGQL